MKKGKHQAPPWEPKSRGRARSLLLLATTAIAVMLLSGTAMSVDPLLVAGNPSCTALGYDFGFKPQPEPPPSGTYTFPGTTHTVTIVHDGTYVDWESTLGIDAVIVKGGPNANVYVYEPPEEEFSDDNLHAPINPNNNAPFGLSHLEFCYDFELDVSKTADTSFTRTFEWDIDKTVAPATWDLFTGDAGTSEYTVEVIKTGYTDSDWAVSGTITIENNTPASATIASVTDAISGFGDVDVDCGVTFPYVLASGGDLECSYSTDLLDGVDRTNTATVTTSGAIGGGEAEADVDFGDPTTTVNDTINVEDQLEDEEPVDLGEAGDDKTFTYTRTFDCDGDEGTHDNTATIVETGQDDSASVTVNCHALVVTKDADTSFKRTWDWTIEKSADQTDLTLSEGQLFTVNYEVTVDAMSSDSEHAVSGGISVNNPAPIDAIINAVSDIVSPAIVATVDCGVTFPYTLVTGGTLNCTYSADLPDDEGGINTATAALQNHNYDEEGVGTPEGTTDFTGSASVTFSDTPSEEVDECIDVSDTNVGVLGEVCADDAPKTFMYSLDFGAHPDADVVLECGDNTHRNVADFVTNDTGATDDDDWTVNATVECETGCTLTPGYWKTHSSYGPAPYDDTWALIGENTPFFLSGKTYYQALWTAPAGNAYYILSHAYIATELNMLNGATVPAAVQDAFDDATTLFNTYTPAQIAALRGNNAVRKQYVALAGILDAYNNGLTGPGHCSDDQA